MNIYISCYKFPIDKSRNDVQFDYFRVMIIENGKRQSGQQRLNCCLTNILHQRESVYRCLHRIYSSFIARFSTMNSNDIFIPAWSRQATWVGIGQQPWVCVCVTTGPFVNKLCFIVRKTTFELFCEYWSKRISV